jgi:hypothetical protein
MQGKIFRDLIQVVYPVGVAENAQTLRLADFVKYPQTLKTKATKLAENTGAFAQSLSQKQICLR